MSESTRRSGGFTLVELLVVISIVALLIALLLPALGRARDHTQLVICSSHTRQFGLATMTYLVDNLKHLPRGAEGWDYGSTYGVQHKGVTFIRLAEYLGLQPVYPSFSNSARNAYYESGSIFRCPSREFSASALVDYSVNSLHFRLFYTQNRMSEAGWTGGAAPDESLWPTKFIANPSQTILYAENNRANFGYRWSTQFFAPSHLPWSSGIINPSPNSLRMMGVEDQTHQGLMAYTAFDGSAHTISLQNDSEWPANNARLTGNW